MESLDRHALIFARSGLECTQTMRVERSRLKISYILAILLLAGAVNSGRSEGTLVNLARSMPASSIPVESDLGIKAQIVTSRRTIRINVEGFNKQRDVEIAKDSRQLLSLALALKTELARHPEEAGSPAALVKVKLIEKLAREVKEMMQMNPALGPI